MPYRVAPNPMFAEALLRRQLIDPDTGCWIWQGAIDRYGYGKVKWKQVLFKAHRASLQAFKGLILLSEEHACHSCDNRRCFNPEHLTVGDASMNMSDMWARKRYSVGRDMQTGKFLSPITKDLPF